MIVHFKKRRPYTVKVPLASLIDIVFLLLIYFLLTTNFIVDEGIKIRLPKADASSPQVKRELVISVQEDGTIQVGSETVAEAHLFSAVREKLRDRENRTVIIRADKGLVLEKAVRVMDLVKAAGAERLCLATEKTGKGI